jgi:hypothetical protein
MKLISFNRDSLPHCINNAVEMDSTGIVATSFRKYLDEFLKSYVKQVDGTGKW